MTAEAYIQSVIDRVPRGMPLREQIAMELGSHIAERVAHGQPLDEVIRQLGDPLTLAESYLAAVPLRNAPFWPRAFAKIVDFVIACAGAAAVALVVYLAVSPEARGLIPILCIFTFMALFPVYTAFAEYTAGQTIGKRLMNIRVVRESGARIGLGQALLRQLPFFAQFFWIDIIFALFTEKSQRAFEMLTKTRAVLVLLCVVLAMPAMAQQAPPVVLVQEEVAKTNRVCSSEDAGMGWSDPGEPELTLSCAICTRPVDRTAEQPPDMLVGTSRGGVYSSLLHEIRQPSSPRFVR
jgi:uncharacterized RDD family membrane protein YckC